MQFGIQGSWSVVPIHLSELSPPHFRSFVSGVLYQLGNLVSSASSTIEATIEEQIHDYGKTMAIFIGAVLAYLMFVVLLVLKTEVPNWVLKEMTSIVRTIVIGKTEVTLILKKVILLKDFGKPEVEHKE